MPRRVWSEHIHAAVTQTSVGRNQVWQTAGCERGKEECDKLKANLKKAQAWLAAEQKLLKASEEKLES
jgi:hypothetical protein